MAMEGSGGAASYPDRFHAAAAYVGFGGSHDFAKPAGAISRFPTDVALLLYGLYHQATVGPCNVPKPRAWNPVEHSKWTSWNGLGNMASTEAMRLFVKILEEEDPAWYSRALEFVVDPVIKMEMNKPKLEIPNGNSYKETKTISPEVGGLLEAQDKDVVSEGISSVSVYDQWIAPSISGPRPRPRYEHGAAVNQEKMYIFGGNYNGRYLNDIQVLDLKSLTWSKVEVKAGQSFDSSTKLPPTPCAGHSLLSWDNKIFSVAGHTKDPSDSVIVKEFDPQTCTWSNLKTYGKAPVSRGGQSVSLVGATLVMFGGEDAKKSLLNDVHILDLETMTWDEADTVGVPPSPRSGHAAAVHAERYLLIFGGGTHATCFNDLHVLDLQSMEWSRPTVQGVVPAARAGHAGVALGENWFIVGGGDNMKGVSETLVLDMSTMVWSVLTTVQGHVPVASEGLSLVASSYTGEDILVQFGGYNGRYNNEVYVLKPSCKSATKSKIEKLASDEGPAEHRDVEAEIDIAQDGNIREIVMDNVNAGQMQNIRPNKTNREVMEALKAEKEELETILSREQLQTLQLQHELVDANTRNADLREELQSVRSQLAAEQSRCFKLEVDAAELRQKLQATETLKREVEILRRQIATSEQAALNLKQKQRSRGAWGWLAGSPPDQDSDS